MVYMFSIRPDIRRAVVCAALSRSLIDSWDFVFAQYQLPWQGPDAVDRPRLRSALACSTDRSILNRFVSKICNIYTSEELI